MPKVHLSGQNRNIPAHALNAPIKNTFEQKNIRFHVNGQYLTDMSDKGIEKFIKKHVNSKSGFLGGIGLGWGGKDLDVKEVKAFLQAVAANADQMENFTFDLTDPELGLYDDDDITLKDIQHSFHLNYEPNQGSSNTSVSFVDATGVQSDYQQAKTYETQQHDGFKTAQKTHRGLQSELQSAQKARDKIADRIGDKATQQLLETDNKLSEVNSRVDELNKNIADVRTKLRQKNLPAAQQQELRLMSKGMELELKELHEKQDRLHNQLEDNHGFWSFLGGGSSLDDLREANAKVEKAQAALNANKAVYEQARNRWQDAVSQREAVEKGESWADVHGTADTAEAPPAPSTSAPSSSAGGVAGDEDTPSADATPTTASPAPTSAAPASTTTSAPVASPANVSPLALASEQSLQQLLTLTGDAQLTALQQVPAEQRDLVLKMADDYWVAGQEGNVFGLSTQDFDAMKGLQASVAKLRVNALLSWGEETQNTYLASASDRTRQEIERHLNQQLFDQQLAQQASALQTRLQGSEATVPVGESPQVTQAGAPESVGGPAPAAGLNLERYATLPPEAKLQQFKDLSAADQQTVFQAADAVGKSKVMATLLSQGMDPVQVQGFAESMSATDRSLAIHELNSVLAQTTGPAPQKTELSLVLGMLRQLNGMTEEVPVTPATPTPSTPTNASPTPTPTPAQPTPVVPDEPERPGLIVEDPVSGQTVNPTPPSSVPDVSQPTGVDVASAPEPTDEEMGQALLVELAKLAQSATPENPAHLQAFAGLSAEDKQLVFKVASPDIQAELLFAIGETAQSAERQQVLNALSAEQKTALGTLYQELLPNFGPGDQEMTDAIRRFLSELGQTPAPAASATPEPSTAPVDVTASEAPIVAATGGSRPLSETPALGPEAPVASPVSQEEGRLDMTMQLTRLSQELKNTSWTGGLMNNSEVNTLIDEIWERGTQQNRQQMANLLVKEDQADKLSNLVVDYDNAFESVATIVTAPGFPVKEFMAGVENDDRAGLILSNMSELAMKDTDLGKAASTFVMKTLEEYKDGIDREGPIKTAKKTLEMKGLWDQVPVALTKEMKHILDTYWN